VWKVPHTSPAETKHILDNILRNSLIELEVIKELLIWYDVITKQIYFSHNNQIRIHRDGLAMGIPSSSVPPKCFYKTWNIYTSPRGPVDDSG
jgi:hypothetical protein